MSRHLRRPAFILAALVGASLVGLALAGRTGAGPEGGYLDFQGPGPGYFEVAHDGALNPAGAITVEAWVYLYGYGGFGAQDDCPLLVGKNWSVSYALGLACGGDGGNSDIADAYINGAELQGSRTIPLQTWTHIAMTYDGSVLRLFVGGELDGELALDPGGPINPSSDPLRIGSDAQWDFTPWARIDDVRIWQIARSQQAIALTMDGVQPDAVGLVANWTFGGGSLSDSVSGRTGVLAGDASVQFLPTPTPSPAPTPKPSPTPSPTPIGSPVPPGVLGDVNCDAHIGPGDVVALLAAVAAVSEPQASCEVQGAGAATSRLDVDCSGTVDARDALALLSYLAGIAQLPLECPAPAAFGAGPGA